MNNKTFLVVIFFLFTMGTKAQLPFQAGDLVIGGFMAQGGKMDVSSYSYMSKVKGVVIDAALPIRIDTGYIGLGFLYGTRTITKHYDYPISSLGTPYFYDYNWDYKIFGGRLSLHIDLLGIKHLDTYLGFMVSYNQVKFTAADNLYSPFPPYGTVPQFATPKSSNPYPTMHYPSYIGYSGFFGLRYDIFNFLGVYGEVAFGPMNFTYGVTIKI